MTWCSCRHMLPVNCCIVICIHLNSPSRSEVYLYNNCCGILAKYESDLHRSQPLTALPLKLNIIEQRACPAATLVSEVAHSSLDFCMADFIRERLCHNQYLCNRHASPAQCNSSARLHSISFSRQIVAPCLATSSAVHAVRATLIAIWYIWVPYESRF